MKKTLQIRLFLNIGYLISDIIGIIIFLILLLATRLPTWSCILFALIPVLIFTAVIHLTRFLSPSHTRIGRCLNCGANLWRIYVFFAILEPDFCPYCGYDLDADEPTPEERLSYGKVISPPDEDAENKKTKKEDISDRK